MKKYETPEVYIRLLYISNIITTSPGDGLGGDDNDDEGWTKLY